MSRIAPVAVLLLLISVPARAGGLNIAWGTGCWPENPTSLITFACDTNTGTTSMTGSCVLDRDMPLFNALLAIVDMQSASPTLPDWWQMFKPGTCREPALSATGDFSLAPGGCGDPWLSSAFGGVAVWQTHDFPSPFPINVPAPDRARLKVGLVRPSANPLFAGIEYYAFRAMVNHQKTVGTGACAGCSTPATFVLNVVSAQAIIDGLSYPYQEALFTMPIANSCVHWQAVTGGLCGATPARNPTWGQVKSLYR